MFFPVAVVVPPVANVVPVLPVVPVARGVSVLSVAFVLPVMDIVSSVVLVALTLIVPLVPFGPLMLFEMLAIVHFALFMLTVFRIRHEDAGLLVETIGITVPRSRAVITRRTGRPPDATSEHQTQHA